MCQESADILILCTIIIMKGDYRMEYQNNNGGSTAGTIAGVIMGIGALIAVIGSIIGKKNDPKPLYAIPREGPTVTDYTPQMPVQQPVVMKPNIPAPAYVPTYLSSYPWGYNAYVAALANTPMQNNNTYQYYPVQDMSCGYYYASPRVFEWNTDYGRTLNYQNPKPYIPQAPPGNMQPQFAYNVNYGAYQQPTFGQQQQMSNLNTPVQPSCSYNFQQPPAYQRLNKDGTESVFNIPACYDNNGDWKGWS